MKTINWKDKLKSGEPKRGAMYLNLKPEVHKWLFDMGDKFGVPATKVAQVIIEEAMQNDRAKESQSVKKPRRLEGHA